MFLQCKQACCISDSYILHKALWCVVAFFPIKDKQWSWFAAYWCDAYKLQLGWKHCWAGQQSIFKVKCGGNSLVSGPDWLPGVPSVVLGFAAKFKPLELRKQSVAFSHSSTDSQLTSSSWLSDELFAPSTDVDVFHVNPLKSSSALGMCFCPVVFPGCPECQQV